MWKKGESKKAERNKERQCEKRVESKKAKEKQRETPKKTKCPFYGENSFFCQLKTKKGKQQKHKNKTNKNKEGPLNFPKTLKNKQKTQNRECLGPSEVALWATSPDP